MTILERVLEKIWDAACERWCPICDAGRPIIPGAIQIECWNCGVTIHHDNWNTAPQKKKSKK